MLLHQLLGSSDFPLGNQLYFFLVMITWVVSIIHTSYRIAVTRWKFILVINIIKTPNINSISRIIVHVLIHTHTVTILYQVSLVKYTRFRRIIPVKEPVVTCCTII